MRSGSGYLSSIPQIPLLVFNILLTLLLLLLLLNPILLLSAPCPRFLSTRVLPPSECVCAGQPSLLGKWSKLPLFALSPSLSLSLSWAATVRLGWRTINCNCCCRCWCVLCGVDFLTLRWTHTHTHTHKHTLRHTRELACPVPPLPSVSLSLCCTHTHSHRHTHTHTLGERGGVCVCVWVADPAVWSVLKRGAERSAAADSTMPVQGGRLKRRVSLCLCLWSRSPLLLLGLFSLHAQAHGESPANFSLFFFLLLNLLLWSCSEISTVWNFFFVLAEVFFTFLKKQFLFPLLSVSWEVQVKSVSRDESQFYFIFLNHLWMCCNWCRRWSLSRRYACGLFYISRESFRF